MADTIIVDVSGGCPNCGNPDVHVPADYEEKTEIRCEKCGYAAPQAEFFAAKSD